MPRKTNTVSPPETKLAQDKPETNGTAYAPLEVPLGDCPDQPDIRNIHFRLTAPQAAAYRRLRTGLTTSQERLDDGRLIDPTNLGHPIQWLLERISDA